MKKGILIGLIALIAVVSVIAVSYNIDIPAKVDDYLSGKSNDLGITKAEVLEQEIVSELGSRVDRQYHETLSSLTRRCVSEDKADICITALNTALK